MVALGLGCPHVLGAPRIMRGEFIIGGLSGGTRCVDGVRNGGDELKRSVKASSDSKRAQFVEE